MTEQLIFNSLGGLRDEVFVQRAYLALLGRAVDPTGYRENLERLRAGTPREQLWEALAQSPESRAFRGVKPAGTHAAPMAGAPAPSASASSTAPGVADLMALHGEAFVRAAYVTVLGREVDEVGFDLYMRVLRSGMSRSYVLREIALSPEAQSGRTRSVAGLASLLRNYPKAQAPTWSGWYWRAVRGIESDLVAAREARMLSVRCALHGER